MEWRALMQTRRTRFLPKALAVEFRRLPWRLLGLWLFALAVAAWLALLSWSFVDPSPSNATKVPPHNLLGYQGASFAAFMMEGFGLASPFLVLPLAAFGIQIASGHMPLKPRLRLAFWGAALMFAPAFFASLRAPSSWPVRNGLGGMFGDFVTAGVSRFSGAVPPPLLWPLSALVFLVLGGWCVWHASGLSAADFLLAFQGESAKMAAAPGDFREPASSGGFVRRLTNWVRRLPASDRAPRGPREFWMTQARTEPTLAPPPAAKPSKRESEIAEAAVAEAAADVEPLFFGVPAKSAASALAVAEAKRPSALTAAEDLAGFQSSPHREREAGGSQRGTAFPSSPHREREAGSSQRGTPGSERGGAASDPDEGESDFDDIRVEPFFGPRRSGGFSGDTGGGNGRSMESPFLRLTAQAAKAASAGAQRILSGVANGAKAAGPLAQAARSKRPAVAPVEEPDSLDDLGAKLPPLSLLAHHAVVQKGRDAAEPAP